ncbi:hypothetical protein [Dawidia soli]|uniref:Uncharacterized protein n=1 Tax=Dawidia soli TaxID=2782352 RepID=A0AAP2GBG7_9BACT|nr:hypothetical protein [Dawidia soli]MBT1685027.1 hypothetical protein [Dawidia soli]
MNSTALYEEVVSQLKSLHLKYETHEFDSGAVMLDIWKGDDFYVLQFEGTLAGISVIRKGEVAAFCTRPDEAYYEAEAFRSRVAELLAL